MIAAIYARKSTDQHVADEAKSVTRQVENALAFALAKGWTVADAHVSKRDDVTELQGKLARGRRRRADRLARTGQESRTAGG